MSGDGYFQIGHVIAVSMALKRSKKDILAALGLVFWSTCGGPCTNCLVYGFMAPEVGQYPGNGCGRCSNHAKACEEPEMSEEEVAIQLPLFIAAYDNFLTLDRLFIAAYDNFLTLDQNEEIESAEENERAKLRNDEDNDF